METGFKDFGVAVKDLCFPPKCLVCVATLFKPRDMKFCAVCMESIQLIGEPYCNYCGRPLPNAAGDNHLCSDCLHGSMWYFTMARAVFLYDDSIAKLLHSFKYGGRTTGLATFRAARKRIGKMEGLNSEPDLVIPVPLHIKRLRQRGFNQALLLARVFFPEQKDRISTSLLKRCRLTRPQTELNGKKRRENLHGAFCVETSERLKGKKVLIVDDVYTTGTTVNECARTLRCAGAQEVQVLTLARVG